MFLITALAISLHYLSLSKKLEKKLIDRGHELEIARDNAEKANAMKSAFIANMSHEIRTPLNAIVGFSQLLTEPDIPLSDEEKVEYGGYIKVNSDTLLNLVNDILQISKMDAKSMEFNIVDADMVEICKTAVESARANLSEEVSIVAKLPEHPGLSDAASAIYSHKLRFGRFVNILQLLYVFLSAYQFAHSDNVLTVQI
ncbi:MAG: hypothetical protein II075_04205 [Bacteroidales bacterium]|nr:hypothetical protein [Bacteroidales bacterium]